MKNENSFPLRNNKQELYLFLWKYAADLTKNICVNIRYMKQMIFWNYDVTVFEQEYLEMIKHWEMVYGKGKENDRKQL